MTQPATKTAVPARRRGRPKTVDDEERRAELLACAMETFVELGYAGTTMDLVAARGKVSKRTLYELFPGKAALFQAMIVAHRETMLDLPRPRDDEDLEKALSAIFRLDISEAEDAERRAFVQLTMLEASQYPEMREIIITHGAKEAQRLLSDWLASQRDRGALAIGDPESDARLLMDMIFGGMGFKFRGCGEWSSREELSAHLKRCIRVYLDGARPRNADGS